MNLTGCISFKQNAPDNASKTSFLKNDDFSKQAIQPRPEVQLELDHQGTLLQAKVNTRWHGYNYGDLMFQWQSPSNQCSNHTFKLMKYNSLDRFTFERPINKPCQGQWHVIIKTSQGHILASASIDIKNS
jgi:hypothetical protein